jgi:hypothetical protein
MELLEEERLKMDLFESKNTNIEWSTEEMLKYESKLNELPDSELPIEFTDWWDKKWTENEKLIGVDNKNIGEIKYSEEVINGLKKHVLYNKQTNINKSIKLNETITIDDIIE